MTASNAARQATKSGESADHPIAVEPSPKRVRVIFNGKTVVDTLRALLLLETGHMPVYFGERATTTREMRCPMSAALPSQAPSRLVHIGHGPVWEPRAGGMDGLTGSRSSIEEGINRSRDGKDALAGGCATGEFR